MHGNNLPRYRDTSRYDAMTLPELSDRLIEIEKELATTTYTTRRQRLLYVKVLLLSRIQSRQMAADMQRFIFKQL